MRFRVGIENYIDGRSQGWALEHPGCFSYGLDGEEALTAMPKAIQEYSEWIESHNQGISWLDIENVEVHLEERWDVYSIDEQFELAEMGYEVNAWFLHDWKPPTEEETSTASLLLSFSRDDLLSAVNGLTQKKLKAQYPGERWSIEGILNHISIAEWWYMDRLGLASQKRRFPSDPFRRLQTVRSRLLKIIPTLAGSEKVVGVDGEFWSPRKVIRRAVWHERDHTFHIHQLKSLMEAEV